MVLKCLSDATRTSTIKEGYMGLQRSRAKPKLPVSRKDIWMDADSKKLA